MISHQIQQYFNYMKSNRGLAKAPVQQREQSAENHIQDGIEQEDHEVSVQDEQEEIEDASQHADQGQEQPNQEEWNQEDQLEANGDEFKQKLNNKGVCYLSRIPPYMKPNYLRKLLQGYMVERIYLLPESEWSRKNRVKKGGNKKICFRQGWIEFGDKRMAKMAALTLNGQKMVSKKGNFYSQDVWNLKYLAKFKWHHLTERLAHEERLKKERLKVELEMERKVDEFYSDKLAKSKQIQKIVETKTKKGKASNQPSVSRSFQQYRKVEEINDQ